MTEIKDVNGPEEGSYEVVSRLGEGSYGSVLLCRERTSSGRRLVAVKCFKWAHTDKLGMQLALREIRLLKSLDHPLILHLERAFRSRNSHLYAVFPYIEGGCGSRILHSKYMFGLPPKLLKSFAWQLCLAVRYLHAQQVLHRDIKPSNVLLTADGAIRLCDFGLARKVGAAPGGADGLDCGRLTSYVQTRAYRAPEVLLGQEYGKPADVWSIGLTIAEMATGRPLLPGTSSLDQLWRILGAFPGGPYPPPLTAAVEALKRLEESSRAQAATAAATATDAASGTSADPVVSCNSSSVKQQQQQQQQQQAAKSGKTYMPEMLPGRPLRERLPRLNPQAFEVVEACLRLDPAQRPSAEQLLGMPWFEDVRTDMAENATLARLYDSRLIEMCGAEDDGIVGNGDSKGCRSPYNSGGAGGSLSRSHGWASDGVGRGWGRGGGGSISVSSNGMGLQHDLSAVSSAPFFKQRQRSERCLANVSYASGGVGGAGGGGGGSSLHGMVTRCVAALAGRTTARPLTCTSASLAVAGSAAGGRPLECGSLPPAADALPSATASLAPAARARTQPTVPMPHTQLRPCAAAGVGAASGGGGARTLQRKASLNAWCRTRALKFSNSMNNRSSLEREATQDTPTSPDAAPAALGCCVAAAATAHLATQRPATADGSSESSRAGSMPIGQRRLSQDVRQLGKCSTISSKLSARSVGPYVGTGSTAADLMMPPSLSALKSVSGSMIATLGTAASTASRASRTGSMQPLGAAAAATATTARASTPATAAAAVMQQYRPSVVICMGAAKGAATATANPVVHRASTCSTLHSHCGFPAANPAVPHASTLRPSSLRPSTATSGTLLQAALAATATTAGNSSSCAGVGAAVARARTQPHRLSEPAYRGAMPAGAAAAAVAFAAATTAASRAGIAASGPATAAGMVAASTGMPSTRAATAGNYMQMYTSAAANNGSNTRVRSLDSDGLQLTPGSFSSSVWYPSCEGRSGGFAGLGSGLMTETDSLLDAFSPLGMPCSPPAAYNAPQVPSQSTAMQHQQQRQTSKPRRRQRGLDTLNKLLALGNLWGAPAPAATPEAGSAVAAAEAAASWCLNGDAHAGGDGDGFQQQSAAAAAATAAAAVSCCCSSNAPPATANSASRGFAIPAATAALPSSSSYIQSGGIGGGPSCAMPRAGVTAAAGPADQVLEEAWDAGAGLVGVSAADIIAQDEEELSAADDADDALSSRQGRGTLLGYVLDRGSVCGSAGVQVASTLSLGDPWVSAMARAEIAQREGSAAAAVAADEDDESDCVMKELMPLGMHELEEEAEERVRSAGLHAGREGCRHHHHQQQQQPDGQRQPPPQSRQPVVRPQLSGAVCRPNTGLHLHRNCTAAAGATANSAVVSAPIAATAAITVTASAGAAPAAAAAAALPSHAQFATSRMSGIPAVQPAGRSMKEQRQQPQQQHGSHGPQLMMSQDSEDSMFECSLGANCPTKVLADRPPVVSAGRGRRGAVASQNGRGKVCGDQAGSCVGIDSRAGVGDRLKNILLRFVRCGGSGGGGAEHFE